MILERFWYGPELDLTIEWCRFVPGIILKWSQRDPFVDPSVVSLGSHTSGDPDDT